MKAWPPSDAVIVVVSQYSAGKPWVRAELDAAMVRRITESTRLIPIRLDGADMPAPLQMLVWHDAARTEDGIRDTARLIADTLHGRDPRPAVASPPAYTSAVRVPGLTAADSTLLTLLAEEAIAANTLLCVPWPEVVARAASQGLDETLAIESLAVLEQRHYAKRQPLYTGGAVLAVELTPRGFRAVIDAIVPGAETARQRIIASLVNTPPDSITVVDDLATLTGHPAPVRPAVPTRTPLTGTSDGHARLGGSLPGGRHQPGAEAAAAVDNTQAPARLCKSQLPTRIT